MTIECICNLFGCCCCHRSSRRRRRCYCCCCYSNVYSENGFVSQQYIVVDHFSSRALLLGIRLLSFVRHFGLHTATPSSRVQAHDTHTHTLSTEKQRRSAFRQFMMKNQLSAGKKINGESSSIDGFRGFRK